MKDIYIVLTYSGTILAKIIKLYTRKKYSHVSISLDKNLDRMYSFGRLNPFNPFIGGFVRESPLFGTFKRFKKTDTFIISFQITDEQYNNIKNEIHKFILEKRKYKFNTLGLFLVALNIRVKRKNRFYCAEFVKYVLDQSEVITNLPKIIKPEDFLNIVNIKYVYEGKLHQFKNYNKTTII